MYLLKYPIRMSTSTEVTNHDLTSTEVANQDLASTEIANQNEKPAIRM